MAIYWQVDHLPFHFNIIFKINFSNTFFVGTNLYPVNFMMCILKK